MPTSEPTPSWLCSFFSGQLSPALRSQAGCRSFWNLPHPQQLAEVPGVPPNSAPPSRRSAQQPLCLCSTCPPCVPCVSPTGPWAPRAGVACLWRGLHAGRGSLCAPHPRVRAWCTHGASAFSCWLSCCSSTSSRLCASHKGAELGAAQVQEVRALSDPRSKELSPDRQTDGCPGHNLQHGAGRHPPRDF